MRIPIFSDGVYHNIDFDEIEKFLPNFAAGTIELEDINGKIISLEVEDPGAECILIRDILRCTA